MISLQNHTITDPPLTKYIKEGELPVEFSRFPCHPQTVERVVKIVSKLSIAVCGKNIRDGYIMAILYFCKFKLKFDSKKDLMSTNDYPNYPTLLRYFLII